MNWLNARQRQRAVERNEPKRRERVEFATAREREDFWTAWKFDPDAMRSAGYSIKRNIDGEWEIYQET